MKTSATLLIIVWMTSIGATHIQWHMSLTATLMTSCSMSTPFGTESMARVNSTSKVSRATRPPVR